MKKTIALLAAVIIFAACGGDDPYYELNQALDSLRAGRAAWDALGINAYRFTGKWVPVGWGEPTPTVTVRPDTEPEVTFGWDEQWSQDNEDLISLWEEAWKDPDYPVRKNPFPPLEGFTIDELYDSIERFIINDFKSHEHFGVGMRFNEQYHYIERVFISSAAPEERGGWSRFEITHFEVLTEEAE